MMARTPTPLTPAQERALSKLADLVARAERLRDERDVAIRELVESGVPVSVIAARAGIGRNTVVRALG